MPSSLKTICTYAGCLTLVESGQGRCSAHKQQQKRERWNRLDQRRGTARSRGYDSHWTAASKDYRSVHPLCVYCLLRGITNPCSCVDHIAPARCAPSLFWDQGNWCSSCTRCNTYKAMHEPRKEWEPQDGRVVVCGLPGTGKTTWAKEQGAPYFDADEHPELTTIEGIQQARANWMGRHYTGPATMIVASPLTASQLACDMRASVLHLTTQYVHREPRALAFA